MAAAAVVAANDTGDGVDQHRDTQADQEGPRLAGQGEERVECGKSGDRVQTSLHRC